MRAEDREPWDQWWHGVGGTTARKTVALCGLDDRFVVPIVKALRDGATVPDLERLLPRLRLDFGVDADEERDGDCAVAAAMWWENTRYSRGQYGVV